MSDAADFLAMLRDHGVRVWVEGEALRYRPRLAVTEAQMAALRRHKRAILALLAADDHEVTWRLAALRVRYPRAAADGAIPFLMVAAGPHPRGQCQSCGDPLLPGERLRCTACLHAI